MAMSRSEIQAVVDSLSEKIAGGHVQKIRQSGEALISFEIRAPGKSHILIVSCERGFSRIHLTEDKPPCEPSPPRFCSGLRKHLSGGLLESLECAENDRIVTMRVKRAGQHALLVCELFPRGGNIILLDGQGVIIDAARRSDKVKSREKYVLPEAPEQPDDKPPRDFGEGDIAFAVGDYYRQLIGRKRRDEFISRLSGALKRHGKRTKKYLRKLEDELRGLGDIDEQQRLADNFAAAMHAHRKGMTVMAVTDIYGEGAAEIPLDPALSGPQNLEKLYSKAKRNRRKKKALAIRIEDIQKQAAILEEFDEDLDQAVGMDDLRDLEDKLIAAQLLAKRAAGKKRRDQASGPTRYTSKDGFEILVGRSSKENDELTFKMARGNDWWFHAVGMTGSHVIVRAPKDKPLSQEALLDAATLAVLKSKLARQGGGEIMYAQRKYLRKAKDGPAGKAVVQNEKVINLHLDDKRVKRLKGQG